MGFNEYFEGSIHGIYRQPSEKNVKGENMASTRVRTRTMQTGNRLMTAHGSCMSDFQSYSDTSDTGYQNLGVGQDYYYFWYWSDQDTWGMLIPGGYSK